MSPLKEMYLLFYLQPTGRSQKAKKTFGVIGFKINLERR